MFSNTIAFPVISHHCAVAGGSGSTPKEDGNVLSAGSSCTLARSTQCATPFFRMILPHPRRGHSKSYLFVGEPAEDEGAFTTSSTALGKDGSRRGTGRVRVDARWSASQSPAGTPCVCDSCDACGPDIKAGCNSC